MLSVCVFLALVILHTKRMHCIISPSVACLSVPYFSTLFYKRHDFRKKKVVESKMRVLLFSTILVRKSFLLRRIQRDTVIPLHTSSRKVSFFLVCCNETRIFWTDFRKILIIPNLMKISLVGAELFHVDGRTDRHTDRQE